VEKEEDAAAGLIADAGALLFVGRAGQQQSRPPPARRSHAHPTFAARQRCILQEVETENARVIVDGFVVITNEQGDGGDLLGHSLAGLLIE
jgi:hypothetical protein